MINNEVRYDCLKKWFNCMSTCVYLSCVVIYLFGNQTVSLYCICEMIDDTYSTATTTMSSSFANNLFSLSYPAENGKGITWNYD